MELLPFTEQRAGHRHSAGCSYHRCIYCGLLEEATPSWVENSALAASSVGRMGLGCLHTKSLRARAGQ